MEVLYSLIPEAQLREVLGVLQSFTQLSIQLIDSNGHFLLSFGDTSKYCRILQNAVFDNDECSQMHLKAGQRAQDLGEAYIFSCHASLNHIAFPLIHQGTLLGSIIVGPFLMDTPDSTIVSATAERYTISPPMLLELYDELSGLPVLPPARVNDLKKLMDYLLMPLMPAERALMLDRQEKLYQQSRINETVQMYKEIGEAASTIDFMEQERQLMTKAKTGDVKETKRILNEILGQVLFSEGGTVDNVRTRAIELTTLLSRVAIDGGAKTDSMYHLKSRYLGQMNRAESIEDICYLLQEILESFMDAMFFQTDKGNMHIRKALQFVANNYSRHITLSDTAKHLGLSENYFSSLFQRTVGISFSEHLGRVRVEESKRLLLSTNYSLAEIAVAVGFPDQSYFSKVFKRVTGVTPRSLR